MKHILMAIHHRHAENIYSGDKLLELRKTAPSGDEEPLCVSLYETKTSGGPGMVTGRFFSDYRSVYFGLFFEDNKKALSELACISLEEVEKYAGVGRGFLPRLVAYDVARVMKLDKPLPLAAFGLKRPPQSWQYVNVSGGYSAAIRRRKSGPSARA